MNIIELYGDIIKNHMNNPKTSLSLIKTGLYLENLRTSKFNTSKSPNSLKYLNNICIKYVLEPLKQPNNSALVSLFTPTEILHSMNIYPLFVEAFSSFLSGFTCEDYFIDFASNYGFSETLCSYHKTFLGAVASGLIPKPPFAITTSSICDANINTFRYCSEQYKIPLYVIDVPYEYSADAEFYVTEQIKEMICMIEDCSHKKFSEEKLKEVLSLENSTLNYRKDFLKSLRTNYFPNTLTLEMYKLFTSHVGMGREETYNFYSFQAKDIKNFSKTTAKRILWVHLLPFYHEPLKEIFNFNDKYQLLTCDFSFDYMDTLDCTKPFNALAKKLLLNQYNSSFDRRVTNIVNTANYLNADGVINFCHWGCKQSSGGHMILKDALSKRNIPFLSLDGDAVDRRNTPDGQIKTRIDAFLEILNA